MLSTRGQSCFCVTLQKRFQVPSTDSLDPEDRVRAQIVLVHPTPKGCATDAAMGTDLAEREQVVGTSGPRALLEVLPVLHCNTHFCKSGSAPEPRKTHCRK